MCSFCVVGQPLTGPAEKKQKKESKENPTNSKDPKDPETKELTGKKLEQHLKREAAKEVKKVAAAKRKAEAARAKEAKANTRKTVALSSRMTGPLTNLSTQHRMCSRRHKTLAWLSLTWTCSRSTWPRWVSGARLVEKPCITSPRTKTQSWKHFLSPRRMLLCRSRIATHASRMCASCWLSSRRTTKPLLLRSPLALLEYRCWKQPAFVCTLGPFHDLALLRGIATLASITCSPFEHWLFNWMIQTSLGKMGWCACCSFRSMIIILSGGPLGSLCKYSLFDDRYFWRPTGPPM